MRFRRHATPKKYLTQGEVESRLYGAPLPDLHKNTRPLSGGALEAKEIINKLQGTNRKGSVMPDIQTALKKRNRCVGTHSHRTTTQGETYVKQNQ